MECLKRQQYVRAIESRGILFKSAEISQVKKEFATVAVVQNEVEFLSVLECVLHSHDEWMNELLEHPTLRLGMFYLVLLFDNAYFKHFHRVKFSTDFVAHKHYFSIGARSQDF